MSSLVKQLRKLQVPGQFTSVENEAKFKPSFLFANIEAAGLDLDTVHSLAFNGLEELISLQPLFVEFTTSLFSESSKRFERTVVSREISDKVNLDIAKFLRLLSPYFLLKSAHKCIEWLVRVYKIHHCNIDVLLECAFPYYETNLFVRIVQLLPIEDHIFWHWLSLVKKSTTPLCQQMLIQHCIAEPSFLTYVCKMVPFSLLVNKEKSSARVVVSFYCSTVTEIIKSSTISNQLVTSLLPFILKGFKSFNIDYKASSYILISFLSSKVKFDSRLTSSVMESLVKVC